MLNGDDGDASFPELSAGMAKYWYRIRLPHAVKAEEVEDLKSELINLFKTTDVPNVSEETLSVTTPLGPVEAGAALERFIIKYRGATFVAGSKIE